MCSKAVLALASFLCLALVSLQANAAVIGVNQVLQTKSGKLFIPSQMNTSGALGVPLVTGGPGSSPTYIGTQSDFVQLAGNAGSSGDVSFEINFDLPVGAEFINNDDSAILALSVHDMDFKPVVTRLYTHYETMTLTLMTDAQTIATVTLDQNNYGLFCTQGFANTNNARLTYQFDRQTLGEMWNLDSLFIETGGQFTVAVTINSYLQQQTGTTRTYRNTPEEFNASLEFTPYVAVPEPLSLLLLTGGGLAMLARRKK